MGEGGCVDDPEHDKEDAVGEKLLEDIELEDIPGDKQEGDYRLQSQRHERIKAEYQPEAVLVQLFGHFRTCQRYRERVQDAKHEVSDVGDHKDVCIRDYINGNCLEHGKSDQDDDTAT